MNEQNKIPAYSEQPIELLTAQSNIEFLFDEYNQENKRIVGYYSLKLIAEYNNLLKHIGLSGKVVEISTGQVGILRFIPCSKTSIRIDLKLYPCNPDQTLADNGIDIMSIKEHYPYHDLLKIAKLFKRADAP